MARPGTGLAARANEFSRVRAVSKFLADALAAYTERPDISGVMGSVEQLLDESVAAQEYLIPDSDAEALFDLAAVDWEGLQEAFRQGRPRTAAERLRSLLSARISALVRLNPSREVRRIARSFVRVAPSVAPRRGCVHSPGSRLSNLANYVFAVSAQSSS